MPGKGHVVVEGDLADPDAVARFVGEAVGALGRDRRAGQQRGPLRRGRHGPGRRLDLGIAETSYDEWVDGWRRTIDVNLLGTANVTYQVARTMIDISPAEGLPQGRIVTVGSRGAYRGEPVVPAYGASKAGFHAMTQSLAVALAPYGITCVGIAPGSSPPNGRRGSRRARRVTGCGRRVLSGGSGRPTPPPPCSTWLRRRPRGRPARC